MTTLILYLLLIAAVMGIYFLLSDIAYYERRIRWLHSELNSARDEALTSSSHSSPPTSSPQR